MRMPEKAKIILHEVDKAYSVPPYLENDVQEAIVKALVIIERKEDKRC